MKNIYIIFILFLNTVFAQVSMSDINKISNQQLDAIKSELQSTTKATITETIDPVESNTASPVSITSTAVTIATGDYFGYNYFRKDISFFDNIPTPADYKLGPGDEITISLWGENNSRENLTINKDGMIYYENIGFINLSNKTLESAELLLIEELSRIYSTLKDEDNPTKLMLELGKLKSINIYFSGHIENPGINLVHPFSDIFSAISQAGGVNSQGSLREVQLIRNDKLIATVDFYSFFMNGKNTFSNIKLIDGDVIHIQGVQNRISISGEVNRPSAYELLAGESVSDLITFSSGFTSNASSTFILNQIIPVSERSSDDNARTSSLINFKNKESITLNNGDTIMVPSISGVDSQVTVYGRVKSPGDYPGANTTLKNVLDVAGGFDDPIFRQTIREDEIVILRKDENQFYSKEISVAYKNADQFKLEINDKIFVYEDINYSNNFTYRVDGEVNKPGTYPFNNSSLTVGEALAIAGGLTELSSERNLTIKQEFTTVNDEGDEVTTSEPVNNVSLDFKIGINSVIIASPVENVVRVIGNVYNPGLITYEKGAHLPRYIELAGGHKPNTLNRKVYIRRANGNIEQNNRITLGLGKNVYPGDTIIVPVNPDPKDFDVTAFISDLSTTLANIAAILLIVDNQTD
ncbi:SLBB domain-containing protein [Candidatus Marinimicrobia bacterium]|nr:SLBB domain-containing protein [Candidatus Neomarinimicrobiota bacterium]